MIGRASRRGRLWVVLAVAIALSLRLTALTTVAATPPVAEPATVECDGCVTVIDIPAWDEFITGTDRAAYDAMETITDVAAHDDPYLVEDAPAVMGTRTVIDVPATLIHHHDFHPEQTVTEYVIVQPAHREPYQRWVVSSEPRQEWVTSGYTTHDWISEGHSDQRWVSSGYSTHDWVSSGYWNTSYVRWLQQHPGASAEDIRAAQSMLQDLISAMAGQGYPGP